jgi:glyoxylase-like metal-dependent hydrolase (beta-lactamase superfamily II)
MPLPTLTLFHTGHCLEREFLLVRGGGWHKVPVAALCALLEHPTAGLILLDTGYAPRFAEATAEWPFSLYAQITPVTTSPAQSVVAQLAARGIAPEAIRQIWLTHLHADHVGGLRDFPQAMLRYDVRAYTAVANLSPLQQVRRAFIPSLLPADFGVRSRPWQASAWHLLPRALGLGPFKLGIDVLGDGSVTAVDLPGHAPGQLGFLIQSANHGSVFLCADACWYSATYRELRHPHPITRLIQHDPRAYDQTIHHLHTLHQHRPDLPIWPFHCPEVVALVKA